MKKIILFVFMLSANWCAAQIFVNQKNINEMNYQYIEIWEKFNKKTGKFHAMVDYGQDSELDKKGTKLKMYNAAGTLLEFNSVVAILNYFHMNGWELTATKHTEGIESYLLKKRANFSIPKLEKEVETPPDSN